VAKLNPSIFTTLDPVLDDGELLFGSGADGYVYQMEIGTHDDGDQIDARWKTGWIDMGAPESIKMFKAIHVDVERLEGVMEIDWSVDDGTATGTSEVSPALGGGGVWDSVNKVWDSVNGKWGGYRPINRSLLVFSLPQLAQGKRIQFTIRSPSGGGVDWQISSYSVWYRFKDTIGADGENR
jgi:hypothetical protein